ncbi:MAG TPA: hypothetical protein VI643_04080 [Planctomycetota bacterium]|nr:hypothetical protein [Planctomycetota bacterium]
MIRPQTVTARVRKVIRETRDTATLRLGLDNQAFEFRAGMAVNIDPHQFEALAGEIARREAETGRPEMPRAFSLASSPLETEFIELTIKVEEPAGGPRPLLAPHLVRALKSGDKVTLVGPFGLFVLPEPLDPEIQGVLYVAAGSGVAPIRGILKHCLAASLPLRHLLLVQNKTSADIIYATELEGIAALNEGKVRVVNVLSRDAGKAEGAANGYLTPDLIRRELSWLAPAARVLAFVCGPGKPRAGHAKGFVDAYAGNKRKKEPGILTDCGIPLDRIVTETW